MPEYQIDHYDVKTGWSQIPEPYDGKFNPDELAAAGVNLFATAGEEGGFRVLVYSTPHEGFLILIDGIDGSFRTVATPDLPSMVDLMSKLVPLALASELDSIRTFANEMKELLIREHGPLRQAYEAWWERERAAVTQPKAKARSPRPTD